jgi:hypothetical protein
MQGIKIEQRSIGAHDYTLQTHGAIKGRAILLRIVRVAGTSLSGLQNTADLGNGIAKVLQALSEEDLTYLCDEFSRKTTVKAADGAADIKLEKVFEVHFACNYFEMCQWLAFCIEVNFGGFFSDAAREIARIVAGAAERQSPVKLPSKSQTA